MMPMSLTPHDNNGAKEIHKMFIIDKEKPLIINDQFIAHRCHIRHLLRILLHSLLWHLNLYLALR